MVEIIPPEKMKWNSGMKFYFRRETFPKLMEAKSNKMYSNNFGKVIRLKNELS